VRSEKRDALQAFLNNAGVGTLIHYPIPPHLSGAYSNLGFAAGSLPVAEEIASTVLSLPIGPHLSAEALDTVIGTFKEIL
jgi:dTDP-3-amino-3,4,6-trideoxy-alpha-D-glucose transaminase